MNVQHGQHKQIQKMVSCKRQIHRRYKAVVREGGTQMITLSYSVLRSRVEKGLKTKTTAGVSYMSYDHYSHHSQDKPT